MDSMNRRQGSEDFPRVEFLRFARRDSFGNVVALTMNPEDPLSSPPPRHKWPWFVLALVLLGVLFAVLWVALEVRRLQWQKEVALPESGGNVTNSAR
jgi:hypothetical protein